MQQPAAERRLLLQPIRGVSGRWNEKTSFGFGLFIRLDALQRAGRMREGPGG